ncbi:MAG: RsmD family RNA methyltransferase [Planctomycetota bacterium]|nr:RsmD family RNA methyltransferase [Planctomycetota bacterium]
MRILAGAYKGRRLLSPPLQAGVRPITGSVKKSLFGMLGRRLPDAVVVDLYCGTGTMGLEALSQGGRRCCFADSNRAVLAKLRRNMEALSVTDRCVVWQGDVERRFAGWLDELSGAVDVAFVDPPYALAAAWSWPRVVRRIFDPLAWHLADDGVVVLRLPRKVAPPDPLGKLAVQRTRQYGGMVLALLGLSEESE